MIASFSLLHCFGLAMAENEEGFLPLVGFCLSKPHKLAVAINLLNIVDHPVSFLLHLHTNSHTQPNRLTLVTPGGGHTGPRHWFFARCTLTGGAIGLKFYDFSSNSIPGQKCN